MFLKTKDKPEPTGMGATEQAAEGRPVTRIASDMTVIGSIRAEGEIRIEGRLEGEVECSQAVLGAGCYVEGSIVAKEVTINGEIKGRVRAPLVTIGETAKVKGTITHHTLSVEPGAIIDGRTPWRPKGDWDE